MELEELKLNIKNFWRHNEKLIIAITAAFILGSIIATANYLNYQDTKEKLDMDRKITINNSADAEFEFVLEKPGLARETKLRLTFENVSSDIPVDVLVNGQEVEEGVTSNSAVIGLSPELLENKNTVRVTRTTIGFRSQALTGARVTSRTNFQQIGFIFLNIFSVILMGAPIMYIKYKQYIRKKKMEQKFPELLRDVVEGTRAGMSLPQAIQNTQTGSYGPLDDKIEKMNAQLDWGIPFDQVLKKFGEETGSPVVRRSVDTIIQAYQSGGNIQEVLESVGDNIRSIRQLKKERQSQLYGEMVTGYIVYFIFIGILVALTTYLLPNLANAQQSLGGSGSFSVLGGGGANLQENISLYNTWFSRLVFIQAFFSGLIIGKLSEGSLKAGFKHMAILLTVGYLTTTFLL